MMANQTGQLNSSSDRVSYGTEPYFIYPISVIYVALISIATIGNTLVIITICSWSSLRKSTTNFFILSLAVSDLLTASVAMPLDLDLLLSDNIWRHGKLLCEIWATVYLSTVPTSILTLMAVGLDRYKTLSDPLSKFREYQFMTRKRAVLVVIIIWVYSVMFAVIPFMGWQQYPTSLMEGQCLFNITYIYSAASSFINFIIPLLITSFLYGKIYLIAYRHNGKLISKGRSENTVQKTTAAPAEQKAFMNNLKAAKTVSVIVSGFIVCWLPFCVLSLTMSFCFSCLDRIPEKLYASLLLLGYSNCALNPCLYSFKNQKFRKFCRLTLMSVFLKNPKRTEMTKRPSYETQQSGMKKLRLSEIIYDNKDAVKLTSFARLNGVI